MTAMRDPLFWRINKKIVQLINNALNVLPTYTRNELYFPGVEVRNVEIKKMMTSFDNFQFDVTDSLKTATANTTFQVKIVQPRLNHKPFTIKLNVSSLVTKKAFVKIYLGPKMMPGELALKKHLFVLLDMFELSLKRGSNVVSRSSEQMSSFSDDFMSLRTLKKKVEDAEFGLDALPLHTVESQIGYPSRLILPKGLSEGLPLQMFVFVAPFTKSTIGASTSMANIELNTAILSPGYPFDLPIETRQLFGLPNAFVKDIIVTHKSESKPNGGFGGRPSPKQPYDNSQTAFTVNRDDYNEYTQDNNVDENNYDDSLLVHGLLGDRPDFTYRKTNDNDFSAKKNQYRKKDDYATRRTDYRKMDFTNKDTEKRFGRNEKPEFEIISEENRFDQEDKTKYHVLPVHGPLGERPAFTFKNKDTANVNQYRKKDDYAAKRVEYKKVDFQSGADKMNTNEDFKFSYNNIDNMNDPKMTHDKSDEVIAEDFSTNDIVYDNTLPVHGLQGKTSEDVTVKKHKYEIKKDNYVQKAETKKMDYRKKAFDKKAQVGILDYTLLEKPEDPNNMNEYISHEVEDMLPTQKIGEKVVKNALEKKLQNEIVGDKDIKEKNNKSLYKKTKSDEEKSYDSVSKDVGKNKEVTISYTVKDKNNAEKIETKDFFNKYDQISKIINKDFNKNRTETTEPDKAKDKHFYKIIRDGSEEIDFYDEDGFAKTINRDIAKNKDATTFSDTMKDMTDKTETDGMYEHNMNGFTKTINKDVFKNKNPEKVTDETTNPATVRDYSIETYFNENVPVYSTERTKKRISVYDFLFPYNLDDEDSRVYE